MKRAVVTVLAASTAMVCVATTSPAQATTTVKYKDFTNCTAMNKQYHHGVGRQGAHDHTTGTPVTNFYRNTKLYSINKSHDGDHDGIACEKR